MEHQAEWWDVRMARNPSGTIYTCPLCDGPVHSATEHMLITPEGNANGRRHAHTDCVRGAIRMKVIRARPSQQARRRRWFRWRRG